MTEFQLGDQVRFRLGERMPITATCCGAVIDDWQLMVDLGLIDGVFVIAHGSTFCPECHRFSTTLKPIKLHCPVFTVNGESYNSFGAYPEELTLVEE